MAENGTLVCFICREAVSEDDTTVTRGLDMLIRVSKERGDNHHIFLEKESSLKVHQECRRRYTVRSGEKLVYHEFSKDETTRFDHLTSPKRKKRRSNSAFDFQANCLFCTQPAPQIRHKVIKDPFTVVRKPAFQPKLMITIKNAINQEDAKVVLERISTIDLVSACRSRFLRACAKSSDGAKPGRPKDPETASQICNIVDYINKTDEQLYSVAELMKIGGMFFDCDSLSFWNCSVNDSKILAKKVGSIYSSV